MSDRIALAFPFALEHGHLGKDVVLIPEGLRRLGFDVELHCPEARGHDWPLPVVEAGRHGLDDPAHWEGRGLAGVVAISFLHFSRLLLAARASGARVVAKADSTGKVLARVHPRDTLDHARFDRPTLGGRAISVALWAARLGPLHRWEARELIRAVAAADATVVETEAARHEVEVTLARVGAHHLSDRLTVVPNPIADAFLHGSVRTDRETLVVAIGRWDIAAKDAPLLADALDRFLADRPDHRAVVVGRGGAAVFSGCGAGRLEYRGALTQDKMSRLLSATRIVVSSSRWESFSLSSHEALAMGCSVVGPALAPLRDVVAAGPYGTLASHRTAPELAAALGHEADAWVSGSRDPQAISSFWRRRLDVEAIARRYATLLNVTG